MAGLRCATGLLNMREQYDDDLIVEVLDNCRRIALVGASENPSRPSHSTMAALLDRGYDITPVNPAIAGQEVLGRRVVASLDEAGEVDMVECFRRSEFIPDIAMDTVRLRIPVLWLQLDVFHPEAAEFARDNGVVVIQDRCPLIELRRLGR